MVITHTHSRVRDAIVIVKMKSIEQLIPFEQLNLVKVLAAKLKKAGSLEDYSLTTLAMTSAVDSNMDIASETTNDANGKSDQSNLESQPHTIIKKLEEQKRAAEKSISGASNSQVSRPKRCGKRMRNESNVTL